MSWFQSQNHSFLPRASSCWRVSSCFCRHSFQEQVENEQERIALSESLLLLLLLLVLLLIVEMLTKQTTFQFFWLFELIQRRFKCF
jgi:hypothetical protein